MFLTFLGFERALDGMCGDLRPQCQLQSSLAQERLQVLLQCGGKLGAIVGAGKAQYDLYTHPRAIDCDGSHSLCLPQSLGEIGIVKVLSLSRIALSAAAS